MVGLDGSIAVRITAEKEAERAAAAEGREAAEELRKQADQEIQATKAPLELEKLENEVAAGAIDPETGLTRAQRYEKDQAMLTPDWKNYLLTIPQGEKPSAAGYGKFLDEDANRKKPVTNITVNGREQFKDESQLRSEFSGLPIVKAYNEIKTQAQRARGAYELAKQAEKEGKSASSTDQVIITVLNKVLDPESVVRESEYARTADGQAALSRLSGWLDKMKRGGAGISSSERASIMETIESLSSATEREYAPVEQRYRGLAGEYGFKPDRVVPGAQNNAPRPTATDGKGNKVEWDGKAWVPVK